MGPAAARTKLKKLQKEEEAKKAAAASKSAADRSPHTKEVLVPQCTPNIASCHPLAQESMIKKRWSAKTGNNVHCTVGQRPRVLQPQIMHLPDSFIGQH